MMETSKSVGRNKKNLPSFARNGASTATLSAFMRTWRLFVVLGMSFDQGWKTCVLRMMVAYCGEFAGRFSTKIPWKFTKLTWWNHQNEESKTSTSTVQFTQSLGDKQIFTVVFSMTQPADLFFIGSAGGSASVPGSVMVGKPQRPTHQDGHFQTKKQGAQLTSVGNWFEFHWKYVLKKFGGWNFTGIQWNPPPIFDCIGFPVIGFRFWCFSPLRPRLWNQRILVARWCFSNRGIQDDDMSMCVLRATKKHGGRWIKHWRWCHDVASRWDFLGGVIGLWERGKRSILFNTDLCLGCL